MKSVIAGHTVHGKGKLTGRITPGTIVAPAIPTHISTALLQGRSPLPLLSCMLFALPRLSHHFCSFRCNNAESCPKIVFIGMISM